MRCSTRLFKTPNLPYDTKMNQNAAMNFFDPFYAAGTFFAAGECRGDTWIISRCNRVLLHILFGESGAAMPENAASLEGESLAALMAGAGLEPVFTALRDAGADAPNLYHYKDLLYIFQWRNTNPEGAENVRAFVLHAIPMNKAEAIGISGWREMNALFDSLHDGIWVTDPNGITLRVNKALEDMTGIAASELEGRHVSLPMRQGRYQASMTLRALEEKRTVTMLDYYENGKRFLNTSTPVFDDAGNVWRVIACIRDMSALEKIQDRLVELEIDNRRQKRQMRRKSAKETGDLIGASGAARRMSGDIAKAARSEAITMILGETGTGKTLAAQTIHRLSPRRKEPFIAINCSALPDTLIESELFGYEKGAFTGARTTGKIGLFESAGTGTIFLDEIAELPLLLQAKLLHVLDGQTFSRVGGVKPIRLKARVIAATNRPLEELVAAGTFREDLYYRVNVLTVRIPPLRERLEDIPALSRYFLAEANQKNSMAKILRPEVLRHFAAYPWPGNVRELRATIEYLVAMSESNHIGLRDLPERLLGVTMSESHGGEEAGLKAVLALKERELVAKAIEETGSTWKAAKRLKISQASVVRKAKRYSIGVNAVVHKA